MLKAIESYLHAVAVLNKRLFTSFIKRIRFLILFVAISVLFPFLVKASPFSLHLQKASDTVTVEQAILGDWKAYSTVKLSNSAVSLWAKLTIIPKSKNTVVELTGYLSDFTLYVNNNNKWLPIRSENVHSISRPMISKYKAYIKTQPNLAITVYIKTNTKFVKPDYRILTEEEFNKLIQQETIRISVIVGFLICIVVISVFYYLIERNKLYLYYSFFVFFLLLPSLSGIFLSSVFMDNDGDPIIGFITVTSNLLVGIFGLLYGYLFLEIKKYKPLNRIIIFYVLFVLLCYIITTLLKFNMGPVLHLLTITFLLVAILVGVQIWRKGNPYAIFFSVAYLFFSFFYSLKLASTYGLIPFNDFYFIYGTTFEVLILAYALGKKVIYEKNENKRLLQTTNAELAKQNTQLEQYSNMVAHNLRAPIARLMGLARIIKQSADEKLKNELIDKLERTTIDFDAVIKEISMMLEIKKGLRFEMESIFLKECVQQATLLLQEEIVETNATVKIDVSEALLVKGMKPYLKSIFLNLMSNAIKYRDNNRPPSISIVAYKNINQAIIIVSDNGLGIDLSLHGAKVFEPFKRFHTHREGRGLGLHLVKVEIEAMKGSITLESELGKGTTFIISLPLAT